MTGIQIMWTAICVFALFLAIMRNFKKGRELFFGDSEDMLA